MEEAYSESRRLENRQALVAGVDGITPSEMASALPRNVLEILQIVTDYQNSPDRNRAFETIWRNLGNNPDLLLRLLNNAYGQTLGTRPTTINAFSLRLRSETMSGGFTLSEFGRGSDSLVKEFITWGKSL